MSNCNECQQRAQAGPNYDPMRRTGRTTRALSAAVMSMLSGHRVLHVSATQCLANEAKRQAFLLLEEAKVTGATSTSQGRMYVEGKLGWMDFKSMSGQLEYRGLRDEQIPTHTLWDHYALESKAKEEARRARQAALVKISDLMLQHGITLAEQLNMKHTKESTLSIC